jgi:hypothetical protein
MMDVIRYSETSVLKRATLRGIPEDGILHSYRREYLISYRNTLGLHRFEVLTSVVLKSSVFWDTTPCIVLEFCLLGYDALYCVRVLSSGIRRLVLCLTVCTECKLTFN